MYPILYNVVIAGQRIIILQTAYIPYKARVEW